jgi:tetratricopeptide (TPR) repeat protein
VPHPAQKKKQALDLFQKAYEAQMRGDLEEAIRDYRRSIEIFPTAEAHTFLGWTYSFQKRYDEAISECRRAIAVDPEYGNPYNDIGAYLIELGKLDEAIPWLEKATRARRYESPCFPHFNLGRVWEKKGLWPKALSSYEEALRASPEYRTAQRAILRLRANWN